MAFNTQKYNCLNKNESKEIKMLELKEKNEVANKKRLEISNTIFKQFLAIVDSGKYNMFDYYSVLKEADKLKYTEFHTWMKENKMHYSKLVFGDFNIIPDEEFIN